VAEEAELSESARQAWNWLFVTQRRVHREVERRLSEAGLPPLQWYDALYSLYLAPERRLAHHELAAKIIVSPSGLSRLVDRMEARGAVERCRREDDRRSSDVALTDGGIELMRQIWPIYSGVIAEFFAPAIVGLEEPMADALERSAVALEEQCPTNAPSTAPARD
jgi:DNA-binding MarR family transcriptional regulator